MPLLRFGGKTLMERQVGKWEDRYQVIRQWYMGWGEGRGYLSFSLRHCIRLRVGQDHLSWER